MIFKTFIWILFKACFTSFLVVEQKQNQCFEEIAMHAENGMSLGSANKCYLDSKVRAYSKIIFLNCLPLHYVYNIILTTFRIVK